MTAAVERAVFRDRAAVQRRRQRHELERRARLIAVGDAAVSPLAQALRRHRLIVRAHRFLISVGVFVQQQRVLILRLQLPGKRLIVDFLIVVGIVAAEVCHRQNLPGVDVHDDAERSVYNIIFFDRCLEIFFQIMLHRLVNRRDKAVSVGGIVVFFICIEHLRAVVALGRDDLAGSALQIRVVICLESLRTDVVGRHKAHHLRSKRRIGIVALGVGFQIHALDLVFRDEASDLVGKLLRNLPADNLIAERLVLCLLVDKIGADVQNLRKPARDVIQQIAVFRLCHLLRDLVGVDEDRLHRLRRGKHVHIPVENLPARGRQTCIARLIVNRLRLIVIVVADHKVVKRHDQRNEDHHAEQHHQNQRPAEDGPVGTLRLLRARKLRFVFFPFQGDDFACHVPAFLPDCENKGGLQLSGNRPCHALLLCPAALLPYSMPPPDADMQSSRKYSARLHRSFRRGCCSFPSYRSPPDRFR